MTSRQHVSPVSPLTSDSCSGKDDFVAGDETTKDKREERGEVVDCEEAPEKHERQAMHIEDLEATARKAQENIDHLDKQLKDQPNDACDSHSKEEGVPPHQMLILKPEGRRRSALQQAQRRRKWISMCLPISPYADRCEICRGCRRPNAPHHFEGEDDRSMPMLTVDYCVLHASNDAAPLSVAAARVRPSRLGDGGDY